MHKHMASVVVDALESLPSRKELQIDSPRTANVKKYSKEILSTIATEENHTTFVGFAQKLLSLLRSPLEMATPATMAKRRERMWSEYARLRAKELPKVWNGFLTNIKCSHVGTEPLLMEIVNETLFEELIEDMFSIEPEDYNPVESATLTEDEENIL